MSQTLGFGAVRLRHYGTFAIALLLPAFVAGCGDMPGEFGERAYKPLSPELTALMQEKGVAPNAPVLIRAFKKEAEVEVWKMKPDGHYTLLKSYPICRWSGQLGPKTREGDRQVPEGFYTIGPSQMNPHSAYYLSFNVGYPNTYDRAHGYTGGEIMVHGVCSSAGCFSMTDRQIAEIYAVAREAFAGGQKAIQFQSFPFHMTAENFAKYRLDPNIAFWKELKVGADNFEVTRQEVAVGVCNSHYVFNAVPANGGSFDPTGACPPLKRDETVALAVTAKEASDQAKVASLVASGIKPVHTVYADGGQNAQFSKRGDIAHLGEVSRPEALAKGSLDVPLDKKAKKLTPAQLEAQKKQAEIAAAAAEKKAEAAHAYAYSEPPPPAQPHFGLPQWIAGQGQPQSQAPVQQAATGPSPSAAATQTDPYAQGAPVAAPPARQGQPGGFNFAGVGHFFGQQQAPQAAPQIAAAPVAAPPRWTSTSQAQPRVQQAESGPSPSAAAAQNDPYAQGAPAAAPPAQQGQPGGFNLAGFGRFFGQQPPAPAPLGPPASAAPPANAQMAHSEPVPVSYRSEPASVIAAEEASIKRAKSKAAESKALEAKAEPAKPDHKQDKKTAAAKSDKTDTAAEASADAAKAAYAAPIPGQQPATTASMPLLTQGFSAFAGTDH